MINLDDGTNISPRSNIHPDDNTNNRTKDEESFAGDINQIMNEMNHKSNKTDKEGSKPGSAKQQDKAQRTGSTELEKAENRNQLGTNAKTIYFDLGDTKAESSPR